MCKNRIEQKNWLKQLSSGSGHIDTIFKDICSAHLCRDKRFNNRLKEKKTENTKYPTTALQWHSYWNIKLSETISTHICFHHRLCSTANSKQNVSFLDKSSYAIRFIFTVSECPKYKIKSLQQIVPFIMSEKGTTHFVHSLSVNDPPSLWDKTTFMSLKVFSIVDC